MRLARVKRLCIRVGLVLTAANITACGGAARDAELRQLRERVEALRTQLGHTDTQIADLQNQMFLISDQLNRERADAEAQQPPPHLKVVKLAPPQEEPVASQHPADVFDIELTGDQEPGPLVVTKIPPPAPIPRHDSAEADALFRDGLTAFREGRSADASRLFGRFVERYPEHGYADKALYWMGEARYEGGAFTEAVRDLRKLLLRYPRSSKVPDALFRLALSYERLGQPAEARQALEDLVGNYPATALADLARARLGTDAGGAR
jgi:tol-pal system protein YbgF